MLSKRYIRDVALRLPLYLSTSLHLYLFPLISLNYLKNVKRYFSKIANGEWQKKQIEFPGVFLNLLLKILSVYVNL